MDKPEPLESAPPLHVAAAVIGNAEGKILIARRPEHLHQGGLWEFPGGKVEAGETVAQALKRELAEELGITVQSASPLLRVRHDYPDRRVLLDVWRVFRFQGEAHGREGQPIAWVEPQQLREYRFPAANQPIVTAAQLPPLYLITPEPGPKPQWEAFLARLEACLAAGVRLVQLRAPALSENDFIDLAREAVACCHRYGARLLINADPAWRERCGADGVHLNRHRLARCQQRPLEREHWLAASCHDRAELERAVEVGVDFVVLSPVAPTGSHPGAPHLGWQRFQALSEACCLPIYALGGMALEDIARARVSGAQGIAAISRIWQDERLAEDLARELEALQGMSL